MNSSEKIKTDNTDTVLMGDLNYDLLETHNNNSCQEYLDSMISNGLLPKITLPTKINRNSCKLYDHIFTRLKNDSIKSDSCIYLTSISDHLPVFLSLNFPGKRTARPKFILSQTNSFFLRKLLKNSQKSSLIIA